MDRPREWLREKSIAKKVLKDANVILEVVDARIPFETRNSVVEQLAKERNKELIIVLNKIDLVPKNFLEKAKNEIKKEYPVVAFSTFKKNRSNELLKILKDIAKRKKIIKVGILGYPNVGKSSLINSLETQALLSQEYQ